MNADPVAIANNPLTLWGGLAVLAGIAAAITRASDFFSKNKRARKAAIALLEDHEDRAKEKRTDAQEIPESTHSLLVGFVKGAEADRRFDREERARDREDVKRQWGYVERLGEEIRSLGEDLKSASRGMERACNLMEKSHNEHSGRLDRLAERYLDMERAIKDLSKGGAGGAH